MEVQEYTQEEEEVKVTPPVPVMIPPEIKEAEIPDTGELTDKLLSGKEVNDLVVAAQVETRLRSVYPCEVVAFHDGVVTVDVEAPLLQEARLVEEFNREAGTIAGVKRVQVHIVPESIYGLG